MPIISPIEPTKTTAVDRRPAFSSDCLGLIAKHINHTAHAPLPGGHAMPAYDPNIRWANHTVEISLQQGDARGTVTVEVGGNCKGADILSSAVESLVDAIDELQERLDEEDAQVEIVLRKCAADGSDGSDGGTVIVSPDGEGIERWLTSMIVGMRVIRHEVQPAHKFAHRDARK